MINPSTYSEDAWKQWHSSRVDRLSASEGWLSLVGLDFLPTASGQTLSFGGPDADLSPEGFPAKRLGQFVLGQEGWRFHAAKHEACTFDGKEADEGLLQTDADGRSTELRVGGGLLVLIERGGRVRFASSPPSQKPHRFLGHSLLALATKCGGHRDVRLFGAGPHVPSGKCTGGDGGDPAGRHDSICLAAVNIRNRCQPSKDV